MDRDRAATGVHQPRVAQPLGEREAQRLQVTVLLRDRDGAPVFLARNAWELGYIAERSPKIKFSDIRERA